MSDEIYFLSKEDILLLRRMASAYKQRPHVTRNRAAVEEPDTPSPEVYLARTSVIGISAPTLLGTGTGSIAVSDEVQFNYDDCQIFQMIPGSGVNLVANRVSGFTHRIHSLNAVPSNTWVVVSRDKYGVWWVVDSTAPLGSLWVVVLSVTPTLVTIGVTQKYCYLASFSDPNGFGFNIHGDIWFYSVNGEIPQLGDHYLCEFFGTATDGKDVWGSDTQIELTPVTVSSNTPTSISLTFNYLYSSLTITAYPATIGSTNVWFAPFAATTTLPVVGKTYLCVMSALANDGKEVWAANMEVEVAASVSNWGVVTTASQSFGGVKTFAAGSINLGLTASVSEGVGGGSITISSFVGSLASFTVDEVNQYVYTKGTGVGGSGLVPYAVDDGGTIFKGVTGGFISADGKSVTVVGGIVTAITGTGQGMVGEI